jgi:hypothetical protein
MLSEFGEAKISKKERKALQFEQIHGSDISVAQLPRPPAQYGYRTPTRDLREEDENLIEFFHVVADKRTNFSPSQFQRPLIIQYLRYLYEHFVKNVSNSSSSSDLAFRPCLQ